VTISMPTAPSDAELRNRIRELESQHEADLALIAQLMDALRVAAEQETHFKLALTSARRIGAAIGILMARHVITDDQAFDLLRICSQHSHRKLRDIAEDVVLTGVLPER
jgi:AmiR/NasT family two-component response regulator